jgi:hypothetical protein
MAGTRSENGRREEQDEEAVCGKSRWQQKAGLKAFFGSIPRRGFPEI